MRVVEGRRRSTDICTLCVWPPSGLCDLGTGRQGLTVLRGIVARQLDLHTNPVSSSLIWLVSMTIIIAHTMFLVESVSIGTGRRRSHHAEISTATIHVSSAI